MVLPQRCFEASRRLAWAVGLGVDTQLTHIPPAVAWLMRVTMTSSPSRTTDSAKARGLPSLADDDRTLAEPAMLLIVYCVALIERAPTMAGTTHELEAC